MLSTRFFAGQLRVARRNAAHNNIGASRPTRSDADNSASVQVSTGPMRVSAAALLISVALAKRARVERAEPGLDTRGGFDRQRQIGGPLFADDARPPALAPRAPR